MSAQILKLSLPGRKLHPILMIILFITAHALFGGNVPVNVARTVARNAWFERKNLLTGWPKDRVVLLDPESVMDGDKCVCYVFNVRDENGFVIVSADDRVTPLLGYSFEGKFIMEDQAPAFHWFLGQMIRQIHEIVVNDIQPSVSTKEEWSYWLSEPFSHLKMTGSVAPLVPVRWNQGCYYNDSCPATGLGWYCYHTPTGCGATAMAQILRYWKFPPHGLSRNSYYLPPWDTLHADFAAANYNWDSMPAHVSSTNPYVAMLMYHCGVSVDMQYDYQESGSYYYSVDYAFRNYFCYSSSANWKWRIEMDSAAWETLLRAELDQGRPLFYTGNDVTTGHFFICDGYQADNYFHFNWGWGGQDDGYFYLNNLDAGGYNFKGNQGAIFNLFPVSVPLPGWDTVGKPAFTPACSHLGNIRISSSGQPWLSYRPCMVDLAYVVKFNGSSWAGVGGPVTVIAGGYDTRLALDHYNVPYLLFYLDHNVPALKKFDGNNWVSVGGQTLGQNGDQIDLALDRHNIPYVSIVEYVSGNYHGFVYTLKDGIWTMLGNASFSNVNEDVLWPKIAIDSLDQVYAIWTDGIDNMRAKVSVFNGSSWSLAGNGTVDNMETDNNSISIGEGTKVYACLAYDYTCKIFRFDPPYWTLIGGGNEGFASSYPDLYADNSGNVFVGFTDLDQATRGTVMKYLDGEWSIEGPPGFTPEVTQANKLAVTPDGTIFFAFESITGQQRVTVQKYKDFPYNIYRPGPDQEEWTLHPNPCTNGKVFLHGPENIKAEYTLMDMSGRFIQTGIIGISPGSPDPVLTFPESLKGVFLIRLKTDTGITTLKLILE